MIPKILDNIKSYSPAPNSGRDSAKFSSEVGHNFPKAEFLTQVTCNSLSCSKTNSLNN